MREMASPCSHCTITHFSLISNPLKICDPGSTQRAALPPSPFSLPPPALSLSVCLSLSLSLYRKRSKSSMPRTKRTQASRSKTPRPARGKTCTIPLLKSSSRSCRNTRKCRQVPCLCMSECVLLCVSVRARSSRASACTLSRASLSVFVCIRQGAKWSTNSIIATDVEPEADRGRDRDTNGDYARARRHTHT